MLDTTRADAVSAYGAIEGTTPTVDALAADGLRFRRALAAAPWTLPSHASLFTGRLPGEHGVGIRRAVAADALTTLAEVLQEHGYETRGVSENVFAGPSFGLDQGFDEFSVNTVLSKIRPEAVLSKWWSERSSDERPFFLFVNLVDPHAPYLVRDENPFLPAGVAQAQLRRIAAAPTRLMCRASEAPEELAVLRGLYHGDVQAVDRRVAAILELVRTENRIVVITSDHGELFGEHDLVSHQFSLAHGLLHVPLIVHGLPGARGVVETPVSLVDVARSIAEWVGASGAPRLGGRSLPLRDELPAGDAVEERILVAEYADPETLAVLDPSDAAARIAKTARRLRSPCTPEQPVFGNIQAALRYPHKLLRFERYPAQSYEVESDPRERNELGDRLPAVARLAAHLDRYLEHHLDDDLEHDRGAADAAAPSGASAQSGSKLSPSDEELRALEALGYIDAEDGP